MNKISKKIVSLVTMAAFALTLVPAAAFAAPAETDVKIAEGSETVLVADKGGEAIVNVTTVAENTDDDIVLWVDKGDACYDGATYEAVNPSDNLTLGVENNTNANWKDRAILWDPSVGTHQVKITFKDAGEYTLKAAVSKDSKATSLTDTANIENLGDNGVIGTITVRTTDAVAGNSMLLVDGSDAAVSVAQNKAQEFEFYVRNAGDNAADYELANADETVYVWAENSKGEIVSDVTFAAVDSAANTVAKKGNQGLWTVTGVKDKTKLTATFANAGDGYTLNATTIDSSKTPQITGRKVTPTDNDLKEIVVNVTKADVKTAKISFVNPDKDASVTDPDKDGNYTYKITDDVTPSGVKVYTVKGVATQKDGSPAAGEVLTVDAKRAIELQGLSEEGTVTTNARGEFEFSFTLSDNGEFDIVVAEKNGDATSTLTVIADKVYVGNIETVEDGGYLLAGNDTKYASAYVGTSHYFADAVQFALTDVNGNEITGNQNFDGKYSLSITKPKDSDLTKDELKLVWDKAHGVYTLEYVGKDAAADLIPGKYTVKIAFKSSDKAATASFNLAKFGTVQDIVLDMFAGPAGFVESSNDAITVIDDQIALGQTVVVIPSYVDENGIKVLADYTELNAGVNGDGVKDNFIWQNGLLFFDTFENTPANNSLVGTTITVKVFDEENGKYVEKELTVVKNYLAETLSFDPTNGVVGEDNKVAVSVVDEEGNLSKVNGELHAYVEDQSNDDAYVELKVKNDNVKNGKGELTLYSDKEGTADVRVVVTANNGEMYGATLTYTFGAEDPNAENTVVMTIGSTDYVVNNDIIKGDAAPYVDAQWRTMVPFRVLGETFGAEVNWDQDTQTVTYTYGDTELTMTIGEETYTVNGTEKTMDTAPVLSGDRTFVPVRFVGEALGYTVTALQDGETGLTASVVFQK